MPEILEASSPQSIIWNDILDIEPLKKFAYENILLMGDAAHATTPNMGQGACMAIEDAAVLAMYVKEKTTMSEAFRQFETKRIKCTTAIVKKSHSIGKLAQLENTFLIILRNTALKLTPRSATEKHIKFLLQA